MQDITHVGEDNIFIEVVQLVYDVTDYTSKLTLTHPNSPSLIQTHSHSPSLIQSYPNSP